MPTLADRIIRLLREHPGRSDREMTDTVLGRGSAPQHVNQVCRRLESRGVIIRRNRPDGRLGNYLSEQHIATEPRDSEKSPAPEGDPLSEDAIKRALETWLRSGGWKTTTAWGRSRGIDIEATKGTQRWVIEVKGRGSTPQEQGNYFLSVLGQVLQCMDDKDAKYSIALPDLPRFRGLWQRLPDPAKRRTRLSALLVDEKRTVIESRFKPETITASEFGSLRRQLFQLLDWIEGQRNREEGPARRVSQLRSVGKIPRHVANLMHTVLGFRDAAEYDDHVPTEHETNVIQSAWRAIIEWAQSKGWHAKKKN